MSASSPILSTTPRDAPARTDIFRALSSLHFNGKLRRGCAEISLALACALTLFYALGVVDYFLSLSLEWRVLLVAPVWPAASFVVLRALLDLIKRRTPLAAAHELARAAGQKQNALVTFIEYAAQAAARPTEAFEQSYILVRLKRQAQSELDRVAAILIAPRRVFRRNAALLILALILLIALRLAAPLAFMRETKRVVWLARDDAAASVVPLNGAESNGANGNGGALIVDEFRVRVVPPAYAGLSIEESTNIDAPIRALMNSQIEVMLHASGAVASATLGFGGINNSMRALGDNRFEGTFKAATSGAFESRVVAAAGEANAPAPLVRALEVYADAPPDAHLTEPTGDQLLRAVPEYPLAIRWTARDDLGLQSVALKYIKSRGEGDAAKFTSGEASPGQTLRDSARAWHGETMLDLARLDMQPGDTLVFWIEARDRNPFANNSGRSASLSIAIKGAEVFKLSLSDLRPNEIGRFLLSERLILLHTEKLHGERARLAPEEFTRRANIIAAEQREFKNSFNDYINIEGAGESEHKGEADQPSSLEERAQAAADERTEIHNHGIPLPPPGTPSSVRDMTLAIGAMWNAEDALSSRDTTNALIFEREALVRLKRAQAAVRYVPPILPRSKPLDLKRRYAGELAEIKTQLEKLARRPASKETTAVRAALNDAYSALAELQATLGVPAIGRASAVARARDKSSAAANRLVSIGGDHATAIAEVFAKLRIVETELQRTEAGGTSEEFAARIGKPLALLAQAASQLYAIADQSTRGGNSEPFALSPADDERADEYFRRLTRRTAP
ncbi:MAG: hypothetical protein ABR577_08550 [Pyrinomonadaceae bacterium]